MSFQRVTVHRPGESLTNPDGSYQRDEYDQILYEEPRNFTVPCIRLGGDRGSARSRELTEDRQTLVTGVAALFPAHVDVRETDEITAWRGKPHEKRFRVTGVLPVSDLSGVVRHVRTDLEAVE